tara:strand:- start:3172 stop:3693 length:522 start_codon:yes stop_codon:yes gene_type:complete
MFRIGILLSILLFLPSCSSPPIKKQEVTSAADYKHYYTIKEEPSYKPLNQKIRETINKNKQKIKAKSEKQPEKQPEPILSPNRKTKESSVVVPKRRIRQTQTNSVVVTEGVLLPMTPRPEISEPSSTASTFWQTYIVYVQALIIAILVIYIYIKYVRAKKLKKETKSQRELNL